jgi:hypothetical protein
MKICTGCKQEMPLTAFHRLARSRDGLAYRCRECVKAYSSAYTSKRSKPKYDPRKNRDTKLRSKYGITSEEYEAMLQEQGGVCAICRRGPEVSKHGRLAVDHDHGTDAVRALLCSSCNVALGLFQDDPDVLMAAVGYLIQYAAFEGGIR